MLPEISSALRLLLRSPGFAATAILTLALGIGANSAVFTVLNALVLKPLPFPDPARIVRIRGQNELHGWTNGYVTMPDVADFRAQSSKFTAVAGYAEGTWILTGKGPAVAFKGAAIRGDFFTAIGVQPRLGRGFVESEFAAGDEPSAVLSDQLWRRVFNADPAILNSIVTLDGRPYHIVGIMPPSFQFPDGAELWATTTNEESVARIRVYATTNALARLKPRVTLEEARAEIAVIASRIANDNPKTHQGFTANVITLADDQAGDARTVLQLFLGAVACVLLIACSNVANLMLARATGRSRELAIRAALGATSGQLLRQTFIESVLLALAGAALGLVFAQAALRGLLIANANLLPRSLEIHLEPAAVIYTILVALLTSVLFGAFPALSVLKTDVQRTLGDRSNSLTGGGSNLTRMGLVISQFALATILACSAGLLVRTFYKLLRTDPGFQTQQILTADVMLAHPNYQSNLTSAYAFYRDALIAIEGIQGVEQVGAVTNPPLASGELHRLLGRFGAPANEKVPVAIVGASVGYHKAMGIALHSGRLFEWGDWADTRVSVILSDSLAKRLFGNTDPLGREVSFASEKLHVIGVVGDVYSASFDEPPEPHIYIPLERSMMLFATFAIRSHLPPERLIESVRQQLARIDPNVPLMNVRTMQQAADRSLAGPRVRALLLSGFAGTALLLAVVGIYGLLAYTVEQRYREMGIRMALGASRVKITKLILGQGLRLAIVGITLGLLGAYALGQALGGLIYGIEPLDPAVAVIASALFLLVSIVASLAPALRAASADPQEILRQN